MFDAPALQHSLAHTLFKFCWQWVKITEGYEWLWHTVWTPPCFTRESNTGVFVLPPPSVKIHHRLTWQPTAGLCQSSSCTLCFKPEAQTSTVYTEHPASSSNINTWAKTKYLLSLKTETVSMIYFLLLFFLGEDQEFTELGQGGEKQKQGEIHLCM